MKILKQISHATKISFVRIFTLYFHDLKKIFTNFLATVVAVGVMLLPSLYAWFNIQASWDPYGNTGNISVAVANEDAGYSIRSKELNVGDSIIQSLAGNNQIGWVFTSKDDAIKGVKSGTYYAAVVIPKDFSQNIASVLTPTITRPAIEYYVNEKKNAIAPKITDKGVGVVQQSVNAAFISEVFTVLGDSIVSISNDMDKINLGENVKEEHTKLSETLDFSSIDDMMHSIDTMNTTIDTFIATLDSLNTTSQSLTTLINTTQDTLKVTDNAISAAVESRSTTAGNVSAIQSSLNGLTTSLALTFDSMNTATQGVTDSVEQALASEDNSTVASYLAAANTKIASLISANEQLVTTLSSNTLLANLPNMNTLIQKLNTQRTSLVNLQTAITNAHAEIKEKKKLSEATMNELKQISETTKGQSSDAFTTFSNSTSTEITSLMNTLSANVDSMMTVVNSLQLAVPVVDTTLEGTKSSIKTSITSMESLITLLKETKASLGNTKDYLSELEGTVVGQLKEFENKVDTTLSTDWKARLESILGVNLKDYQNSPEVVAEFLSAPVDLHTTKLYAIENYGSALSPFYTILCLWVGGLVLVSILKCNPKKDDDLDLSEYKPHQLYLGRYFIFMTFAIIQALVACLGDLYLLKIQCLKPGLFVLTGVLASIVFSNIIYTLTISFGDVGKAVAVILLVLQVAGAGGTFPIEVTPSFFNSINPFLPFTHGITAMRETIGGLYKNIYLTSNLTLLVYLPFSLLFGTVFRQPLISLCHFFEKRLKDTGIM